MTPDDVNRPLLESLSIRRCCREALHRIITWALTRHLRALELSRLWNPRDYAMVPKLLSNSSNSLTSLNVDLGTCCASHSLPFTFSLTCWPVHQYAYIHTYYPSSIQQFGGRDIPFTLSSLTRLEYLTICADLNFYFDGHSSPVRSLTDLIKTAPILKHLKFAFKFRCNTKTHIPECLQHFCSTLVRVRLLTECRATSISLCVSAICDMDRDFDATFLEMVLSALAGPAKVNQLVEQGVLIIRPA